MTIRRSQLVDVSVTSWYHVISKTVRGAMLLENGDVDRKQWIEDRIELLTKVFAIEVGGYAILNNHLHLVVNLVPQKISEWSDEEVLRRWFLICPPRINRRKMRITPALLHEKCRDRTLVKKVRDRLSNLGWFMKFIKEPIARMANKADGTKGAFWQSRYKSIAVLDDKALLAVSAYVDLNVFAAGISDLPENSKHTSLRRRLAHCGQVGRLGDLAAARKSSAIGALTQLGIEDDLWLCPIEDRRGIDPEARPGLLEGFSLGSYLQLIDWTSRLVRDGKARVGDQVAGILDRLGTGVERWRSTMVKLFGSDEPIGIAFAFRRSRLREAAKRFNRRYVANLNGCPA